MNYLSYVFIISSFHSRRCDTKHLHLNSNTLICAQLIIVRLTMYSIQNGKVVKI